MLWAAPLTALLALPAAGLLGIVPVEQPERLAYLFVVPLLGIWSVLVPARPSKGGASTRRPGACSRWRIGLVVGTAGLALRPDVPVPLAAPVPVGLTSPARSAGMPNEMAVGSLVYFGGLFLIGGWAKLADRDRKARFRLWPVLVACLCGLLLWPFLPTPEPYGVAVAALIAIVTQLVSPWNEAAAAYARGPERKRLVDETAAASHDSSFLVLMLGLWVSDETVRDLRAC